MVGVEQQPVVEMEALKFYYTSLIENYQKAIVAKSSTQKLYGKDKMFLLPIGGVTRELLGDLKYGVHRKTASTHG